MPSCQQAAVGRLQADVGELEVGGCGIFFPRVGIETAFQRDQGFDAIAHVFLDVDAPTALRHTAADHLGEAALIGAFIGGVAHGGVHNSPEFDFAAASGLGTGHAGSAQGEEGDDGFFHSCFLGVLVCEITL